MVVSKNAKQSILFFYKKKYFTARLVCIARQQFSTRKRLHFDIISLLNENGDPHFLLAHRTSMMVLFHHAKSEEKNIGNAFARERP